MALPRPKATGPDLTVLAEELAQVARAVQDALDPDVIAADAEENEIGSVHCHPQSWTEIFARRKAQRRSAYALRMLPQFDDETDRPTRAALRNPIPDLAKVEDRARREDDRRQAGRPAMSR